MKFMVSYPLYLLWIWIVDFARMTDMVRMNIFFDGLRLKEISRITKMNYYLGEKRKIESKFRNVEILKGLS